MGYDFATTVEAKDFLERRGTAKRLSSAVKDQSMKDKACDKESETTPLGGGRNYIQVKQKIPTEKSACCIQ